MGAGKFGRIAMKWLLVVAGIGAAGWRLWAVIRESVGQAETFGPSAAIWIAVGASVATVALAGTSARHVHNVLRGIHERRGRQAGAAASQVMHTGAVGSIAVRGTVRGIVEALFRLAWLLIIPAAIVSAGWWHEVELHVVVPWLASAVLGVLAGGTLARRVAAFSRVSLAWRHVRGTPLWPAWALGGAALGAAAMSYVATTWGRIEGPSLLTAALVGSGLVLGLAATHLEGKTARIREHITGQLAAAVGINENRLAADGDVRWSVKRDDGTIVMHPPLPAAVVSALAGDLESRLAATMPDYELGTNASATEGLALVPASEETRAARRAAEMTGGLAFEVRTAPDEPGQPTDREHWRLAPGTRGSAALALTQHAHSRGLDVLRFEPEKLTALIGRLDPTTRLVRERIAEVLRCEVHDVALRVKGAEDRDVDVVTITRAPLPAGDARMKALREVVLALPGGNPGWIIEDDPGEHRTVLTWAPVPKLPETVPLTSLLPATYDPDAWARLPLGVGADGRTLGISLAAGPHALVAGPTGSGKTVALLTLITGALARGHRLVLIDPTKAGLDFLALRPWATAWADELPAARRAMELVYEEVGRRKEVLKRYGEVACIDLPPAVREKEGVAPLTVLIDEFGSLALETAVPKALPKDDPLVISALETNAHRAVIKELVGRVAREARFVSIHLQIALQRPEVAIMGSGELRSNLTSRVQLAPPGKGVSNDDLRMLFDADAVESAGEQIALLDDGSSRGLAVVAAEGGRARGLRVAYSPMKAIPALLDDLGVPRADETWDLTPPAGTHRPPREGEIITPAPAPGPVIEDLGTIDLDDLDLDAAAADPAPEPAPAGDSGEEEFEFDVEEVAPQPVKEEREEDPAAAWGF